MKSIGRIKFNILEIFFILLGNLVVLVPVSPLNMKTVDRDSGVFLYIGSRILHGDLPYKQIWDHKPPVIFYINALGLLIGNGSRWGVWLIEFAALFVTVFIGYKLIKKVFGAPSAIFSMFLFLESLYFLLLGGNFTTEYTLPLQFSCIWLAYQAEKYGFSPWRGFLIGLFCSVAFFTKQNTIGIGIAISLFLIFNRMILKQYKKLFLDLLSVTLGGLSFLLVIVIFFGTNGILPDFWDAAFHYNFFYATPSLKGHLFAILTGVEHLSSTYLTQLAFIGWCGGLVFIILRKNLNPELRSLILIGLIDLPVELFLVSISGKKYIHYYMTLLPIFTFFAGLTFWLLIKQVSEKYTSYRSQFLFTFFVIITFSLPQAYNYYRLVKNYQHEKNLIVLRYIEQNTKADDYVLLWGAETTMNFDSGRRSPTRFVYQYPLYMTGYTNEQYIEEFLSDVIKNKPSLIIDTQNPRTPFMEFDITSNKIEDDLSYLRSHYLHVETLGSWHVYEYH